MAAEDNVFADELTPEEQRRIEGHMWAFLREAQDAPDVAMGGAYVDPKMNMIDASGAGISLWPCARAVFCALDDLGYRIVGKQDVRT